MICNQLIKQAVEEGLFLVMELFKAPTTWPGIM